MNNIQWECIDAYFVDKCLVQQQLESFNELIETHIQSIIHDRAGN